MHKENITQIPPAKLQLIQAASSNTTYPSKDVANPSNHLRTSPGSSGKPDAPFVSATVSVPASAGSLANPVYITGELTFRSLSMAEFCHWKLSCNLSPSPTPFSPLRAFVKQRRVRGGEGNWRQHSATRHGDQQSKTDWRQRRSGGTEDV